MPAPYRQHRQPPQVQHAKAASEQLTLHPPEPLQSTLQSVDPGPPDVQSEQDSPLCA